MNALQELISRPATQQEALGCVHTVSEMARQPAVWRKTAAIVSGAFQDLTGFLGSTDRVLLTGAGSSYYAAASVAPLLRGTFRVAEAIPSTEVLMDPDSSFPREAFLLVSLARSGDSPEGNAVYRLAGETRRGLVKQLVITCNPDGELARLAVAEGPLGYRLLLPPETNDRGLAMTSSFTSLTIAAYALGFLGAPEAYVAAVEGLISGGERLLAEGSSLARTLAETRPGRLFYLASRPFVGGALEAHLKVQEMSAGLVVAKAEDTLGFRHGFMAAVDSSSMIAVALSHDPCRRAYEVDLLREIRQKGIGRKIVVITGGEARLPPGAADLADASFDYGEAPVTDSVKAPLVAVTGQLLGLFISLGAGLQPDNPSPRGVINRVVQGVRIHPRGARA
ncbi:MAG TPA: SIS domain-containing protein [Spirochaetia bacterium]|nr:SIS domain-containing protein [Spirochaetia bacterium]